MKNKYRLPDLISLLWGFTEATVFFIVPDVFITYRSLKGYKAAVVGSLYALAGALIGGLLMYVWATQGTAALHFAQHVPAITPSMTTVAQQDYAHHGVVALLIAPLRGIPYKLYTALAPQYHVGVVAFLAISVVARFGRFIITSLVTAFLSITLGRWLSYRLRFAILVCFWIIFYGFYFHRNL